MGLVLENHGSSQCDISNLNWFPMQKPIVPTELYRAVRDSQLIGMSGYSKEVLVSV